jgi:hypothetical protein
MCSRLGNIPIKQEPVGEQAVFSLLAHRAYSLPPRISTIG